MVKKFTYYSVQDIKRSIEVLQRAMESGQLEPARFGMRDLRLAVLSENDIMLMNHHYGRPVEPLANVKIKSAEEIDNMLRDKKKEELAREMKAMELSKQKIDRLTSELLGY